MASERGEGFGFAPAHDAPIPYMQRIRDYYVTLGYGTPYEWAHYASVPFQPLKKPLAESRVTIITTAAPYQPDKGDQGPGAPYNSAAKFYKVYSGDTAKDHDLRISHVGIDRKHTTAEDSGTWFPLPELRRAAARGRIGSLGPRFHGLPTNRSHRVTLEVDCPEVVARCKADGVDAAILLPNCPVCHQSASLAARALEAAGIATVVMGCAKDIVEYVGVPRLHVLRLPARQSGGPAQGHGLAGLSRWSWRCACWRRRRPRAPPCRSPLTWSASPDWKLDFQNVAQMSPEEIARRRAEFDKQKAVAKDLREEAASRARACKTARRKRSHDQALRGCPRPRLHAGVRRAVRLLPAGAARRRRHQDRAPGRRGHAPQPPQQGVGRRATWPRPGWPSTPTSAISPST